MTKNHNAPANGGDHDEGTSNGRAAQEQYSNYSMSGGHDWPANTGDMDALPLALRELVDRPQWVGWRLDQNGKTYPDGTPKPDKVPYNPHAREWVSNRDARKARGRASSTNRETWGTYAQAIAALRRHGGVGVGLVLCPELSPIVGGDLDSCITDGEVSPKAREIVELLDSYTEVSPSGRGLRILMWGTLPPGGRKNDKEGIEVYESGRFLTITGCQLSGTPDHIEDRTPELAQFHATYFAPPPKSSSTCTTPPTLSDGEILELAFSAKNGARIRALYNGDTSDYESESQSDLALISFLAFYSRDPAQLERLARGSRLRLDDRSKWAREDYFPRTITRALATVTKAYQPAGVEQSRHGNGNGKRPPASVDAETGEVMEDGLEVSAEEQLTDLGNAVRFIKQHGTDLRWVPEWESWGIFDGQCWKKDTGLEANRRAKATALAMLQEVLSNEGLAERKRIRLAKHAIRSQDAKRLRDMVTVARDAVVLHVYDLDTDLWTLNCRNCTVDLRTGATRPHRREDYLSKITATDYTPNAKCPTWLQCLETWLPDLELRNYFQEVIGYALTGSVQEQSFFFLYGHGRNGKGTAMNTLSRILGDYAQAARPEILLAKKIGGSRDANEVAELIGARLVVTKEVDRGRPFSESQLKSLTGGDKRRGWFPYGKSFEYWPTDKIFLEANHKPKVGDTTLAFWRRVKLIPFTVTIQEDQVIPDLEKRLLEEGPGILAWAVRGCLRWQERGRLADPPAVCAAVAAYRNESDILGDFLAERCSLSPHFKTPLADVYQDYVEWSSNNKETYGSKKEFTNLLLDHDGIDKRKGHGNHVYVTGLALKGTAVTATLPTEDNQAPETLDEEVF